MNRTSFVCQTLEYRDEIFLRQPFDIAGICANSDRFHIAYRTVCIDNVLLHNVDILDIYPS